MGERLAVRTKVIALALVAAGIGAAAATVASGSHSGSRAHPRAAPKVVLVVRHGERRPVARLHVFRPPAVGVRAARALPPTGFGLGSVAALALAVVAAGLLFRQVAAEL